MASNPVGVLALHGFTGSPDTMRPVSDALAAAGIPVEAEERREGKSVDQV